LKNKPVGDGSADYVIVKKSIKPCVFLIKKMREYLVALQN
jgi:hypothetical protein